MHPHIFLLLLSSGVSSYFLPQKEVPHLLNETKYSLVGEMLCLLKGENEHITEKLFIPLHVKNFNCAHSNTEIFIHELKMIRKWTCMKRVETDMEQLEKNCKILQKPSHNDKSCLKTKTIFPKFKESLEEFLRWVNQKLDCRNVGRSDVGLYQHGKCSCHDPWKSHRGLG